MNNENKKIYLDGAEKKLAQILSSPDWESKKVWQNHRDEWPMFYNLTPVRKNLLSWLDWGNEPLKVLELGAGTGILTSYFSSLKNVSKIVSVEGSPARAELIRLRCQNDNRVNAIAANIQDYQDEEKYDVVTLIGVLEYAGKYTQSLDPFQDMLNKAASFLKPDGRLILAIENQLGHKYLAGGKEDHYGLAWEGVGGYPHYNGVRTFDKSTLTQMLKRAGLDCQNWYYPFPDYKMPDLILSEQSFATPGFDWLALLDLPTLDYNFGRQSLFNERALLKQLTLNGKPSGFMNSFLIMASPSNKIKTQSENLLAVSLRSDVHKQFLSEKYFILNSQTDQIKVQDKAGNLSEYHKDYHNLFHLIVDAWLARDFKQTADYLKMWHNSVKSHSYNDSQAAQNFFDFSQKNLGEKVYQDSSAWLPGNYLDLLSQNLLYQAKTGDLKIIDQEWSAPTTLPVQLVLDRGMFYLLKKIRQFSGVGILNKQGNWNLPAELSQSLPAELTMNDFRSFSYFEFWFQHIVHKSGDFNYCLTSADFKKIKTQMASEVNAGRGQTAVISKIKKILKKFITK
ncbi:MAG: class I SAM-dependent methyltransferase [Candidatus Komeilibacteria bacterium]|nr:class I SAM-dependent methyltransferase [Candidatus Komeilibacteria bacterium]